MGSVIPTSVRVTADAAAAAADARQQLDSVTDRVLALEAATRQPPSPSAWPWSVVVALVLLMAGIIVASRRPSGSADHAKAPPDDEGPVGADWEAPRPLARATFQSRLIGRDVEAACPATTGRLWLAVGETLRSRSSYSISRSPCG